MRTTVNRRTLKQHLTYNWWKYILFLLIGIFGVDLLYTVTNPRIPDDKKVDFYIYGSVDLENLEAYTEKVRSEEMPWLEKIQLVTLYMDDQYGPMQLMTYIAAGEGDIYMLPREKFLSLASEGAFVPLEEETELMETLSGVDLQRGWRKNTETGENHLYGIPQDKIPYSFMDFGAQPLSYSICIGCFVYSFAYVLSVWLTDGNRRMARLWTQ